MNSIGLYVVVMNDFSTTSISSIQHHFAVLLNKFVKMLEERMIELCMDKVCAD